LNQTLWVSENPKGLESTKHYYANGQRVAMRQGDVVYYLHSDHLGSTSVLSDENGQQVTDSRVAYLPYGGLRLGDASTLPTDYTFTGQRDEAGLGLMHYGARFYSPRLGRFVSADSIVPNPGAPIDLNRYAYARNDPLLYTDPTGHYITLYGTPGVRYAGIWSQEQRELAVRMDEGQVFILRGGTEFANIVEQDLANYIATGNEAYMPAAGGALEGAIGYTINNAAVASGYGARYTSLLSKLAGGSVEPSLVIGAGYLTQADKEGGAGQGPPRGERLPYTQTSRDAAAAKAAETTYKPWRPGDPINAPTRHGYPSWSTARRRYWINEALNHPEEYTEENLARMRQGLAERHQITGEPRHLHHIYGRSSPDPHNLANLRPLWPREHYDIHRR
jgi:RHS repeat-associated protein